MGNLKLKVHVGQYSGACGDIGDDSGCERAAALCNKCFYPWGTDKNLSIMGQGHGAMNKIITLLPYYPGHPLPPQISTSRAFKSSSSHCLPHIH